MKSMLLLVVLAGLCAGAHAQWMLSGNENKIDLTSGAIRVVPPTGPDSISILDFSSFPPKVEHIENVPNTVIGPPSNIAITPDRRLALIADSAKIDPANPTNWVPSSTIHVFDLGTRRVVAQVTAGRQPSGISMTRDGRSALVANRADGTVSVLRIAGMDISVVDAVGVCRPEESASDVAISPDGQLALVTAAKGSFVAELRFANGRWISTSRKISAYGQPYRCVITPDGELGLTAGGGFGNGLDCDAITVMDLRASPIRAIGHITIGSGPESIELSSSGKLLAAVVMNGSNLARENPLHTDHGRLEILARRGKTFEKIQALPVGAIPEGVAFTSDDRHLVVQCHPSNELWLFKVEGERVTDTGRRIKVPGHPSSLRASP
ncbi:MAG: YncE family protein [Verrucomicrobiia bacterium]